MANDTPEQEWPVEILVEEPPKPQPVDEPPKAAAKSPIALNVTLSHPILEEVKRREELPVFLLRVNAETREEFEARCPRDEDGFIFEGREESEWNATYQIASDAEPSNNFGAKALNREGSDWRQGFEFGGREINGGSPELAAQDGTKLTGQKAVMYMRSQMGLGSWQTYPFFASGIWVMFKPPMDDDLLDFDVAAAMQRITLGRASHGLIFSNQSVLQDGDLWDFMMRHVVNTNVADWSPELLAELFLSTDFQAMVTYFASTIYPNGYTVAQPCTIDTSKCTYIAKTQANIGKMVITDNSMLTSEQRQFLADRFKKRTPDEIRAYQKSGKWAADKELHHGCLKIVYKIPTMAEYLTSGRVWIADITARVEGLLSERGSLKDKNDLMNKHALASLLRYYGHFVRSIESDQAIADDPKSVGEMLDILSSDTELCDKIFVGASDYLEERTVSLACIPAWKCPECGDDHVDQDRKHPYLIPINASILFFALKDRRLLRVQMTSTD